MLAMTGHAKKLSDLGIVIPNRLGINRVLQSLPPSYKNFVMNYNMQNMNKELPELFAMLKSAEIEIKKEHQVLMVNKTTSFKKQGKSKGKNKKGGKKAATPPVKPKTGPKPDAECYYCKEKGHWKRNFSKYLADLKSGLVKKKKEDLPDSRKAVENKWIFKRKTDADDVAPLANDTTSRPTSPPSGPMTRARAKAIHDKVNSLLTTLDLDSPLDGMLPHAETLCVIRYMEHQDPGEDETSWSREGEEQRNLEMNMKPKPPSPEERQGRGGRWPVQDPVRPDPRPDAPATGPVNRAQTGPTPSYRTTTGPRTGLFAESRLAGRPDPDRTARHGDQAKEDEVLHPSERLATQHNLWVQRQEFKDQLNLFETRIDEQYEEVAHNFGQVNQDMILLREATDNLHDQVTANDANMERRMDSLERAINNLGRRHRHRSTSSSSSTSSHDDYSRDHHSSSSSDSRHGDHHRSRRPHARHDDSRSNSRRGDRSIAMLVIKNSSEQALHPIVIKLAMPTMGMTAPRQRPPQHGPDTIAPQDQGHQDPPRRDLAMTNRPTST
ncbi:hypothetical protein QYE76_066798 [Lolium multiflorum]|uniref:Uncharacterized protein n=1 Tax=Lolium multiflorum TaxID=4521 RepID=A0AAD8WAC4_LOLMU|nr:hypothetical protein QYE76_066798 [Lolium multiflorum]